MFNGRSTGKRSYNRAAGGAINKHNKFSIPAYLAGEKTGSPAVGAFRSCVHLSTSGLIIGSAGKKLRMPLNTFC
jgi:hypothetical protein